MKLPLRPFLLSLAVSAIAMAVLALGAAAQECPAPQVMLSVDKSYSMVNSPLSDGSSKWDGARVAIKNIVRKHSDAVDFGVHVFPAVNDACDSGTVALPVGPGHTVAEVVAALGDKPVLNNLTPMAEALAGFLEEPTLHDPLHSNHVVLVTDGWQYCGEDTNEAKASVRFAPLTSIRALREKGITVHVVGFGEQVDSLLLNQAAVEAGTAVAGCDPMLDDPMSSGHCYLVASNLEDIEGALEAVANKVMTETCDGHDNDCDGFVDEDFDVDGDSYTTCGTRTTGGPGQPVDNGAADCDDRDGTTFPGAKEACDGRDNDCNGTSDEGCGCTFGDERPCGTAEGTCSVGRQVCEGGAWSECRDGVAPAAVEICDGLDDNCNGQIDDGAVCDAGDTCFEGVCSPIAYTGGAGCSVSAVPGPVTSTTTLLFLAGILGWLSRRRRA